MVLHPLDSDDTGTGGVPVGPPDSRGDDRDSRYPWPVSASPRGLPVRRIGTGHAAVTAAPEVAQAPAPHRVAIFSVVAMALLMSSLDSTIVATALHSIQHGLNT